MKRTIVTTVLVGLMTAGVVQAKTIALNLGGATEPLAVEAAAADREGEELAAYPWEVPSNWLINLKLADFSETGMAYCTPFVACFGESYIEQKELIIDKSLLPKIGSLKIELAE